MKIICRLGSKIRLNSGYWKIFINPGVDRWKGMITVRMGLVGLVEKRGIAIENGCEVKCILKSMISAIQV